jgi:hypothetical protein
MPDSAAPYREYARLLLQKIGRPRRQRLRAHAKTLGTMKDLQLELAQARAAQGQWIESAQAWRQALVDRRLSRAGRRVRAGADAVVDARQIREIFLALPIEVPARRALAELEMSWGSPIDGWNALKGSAAG